MEAAMARTVNGLMTVALVAAMAAPAAVHAVQYNTATPTSSFDLSSFMSNQPTGMNAVTQLAMQNGAGLALGNMQNMNLGQAIGMGVLSSVMSGNVDLGQMIKMGAIAGLSQATGINIGSMSQFSGVAGTSGFSGIAGTTGVANNFGGFDLGKVLGAAVAQGGSKLLQSLSAPGGVSGGTASTAPSIGDTLVATYVYDEASGQYMQTTGTKTASK
jgi:hypothetical protein